MSTTATATKEEQLREAIINAARQLFQQYGFMKTTMEDIAKAMYKGKSTLYYYYKSKEDIFNALILVEIDDVFKVVKEAVDQAGTALAKIEAYAKVSIRAVRNKINLYRTLKGEIGANLIELDHLRFKFNQKEQVLIYNILVDGVHRGELIKMAEDEIESLSYVLINAMRSLCFNLIVNEKTYDWEKQIDLLSRVLIRGIQA